MAILLKLKGLSEPWIVLAVLSAGTLVASCLLWIQAGSNTAGPPPLKIVAPPGLVIPTGRESSATLQVANEGRQPLRIVGCAEECGIKGCVSLKTPLPLPLAPGESRELKITLRAASKGTHSLRLCLYLEAHGLQEVDCAIAFTAS